VDVAVNPYDLTGPSASALVSTFLADTCVTLLPGVGSSDGAGPLEQALAASPRFARVAAAWNWSHPLWRNGVMTGAPVDLAEAAAAIARRVDAEPAFDALGGYLQQALLDDGPQRLDLLCRDILEGGADPGVRIPVLAAVESYAANAGLLHVRAPLASKAGRIESRSGRTLARFTIPCFVQGDGAGMLVARDVLRGSLDGVRSAIDESLAMMDAGATQEELQAFCGDALEPASRDLDEHFRDQVEEIRGAHHVRARAGQISIKLDQLPPDCALTAATRAAGGSGGTGSAGLTTRGSNALTVRVLPWDG
jgi:hypothetical protein